MYSVAKLNTENAQLKGQVIELKSYIEQLEQALILARQHRFGVSSEKSASDQLGLFNEAEVLNGETDAEDRALDKDDYTQVPAHSRKKRGRKPLPENLPRVEVIHDIAEEQKVCSIHGVSLKLIGDKVLEQLDIIPAKVQVIRHIRKQYACPCCEGHLVTAIKPKQPIEKSQASAGTLASICVHKYADGLPLYRQVQMFRRAGIEFDRSTLASWMIRCGELVQPLINLMRDELLNQPLIHLDETPLQVLKEPDKPAQSKSFMWVQASGVHAAHRIILFDYAPTRSSDVPRQLLQGYSGTMMVDGYEGYDGVCRGQSIVRLGCWSHARRKFVEASRALGNSKKSSKAEYGLKLINKLYAIERACKDLSITERYQLRLDKSRPVVDRLHRWLMEVQSGVPPKLALGKALTYLHNQWPRLIRYLDDGNYPIDNNRLENAIRPFVIGRKGWMFATSVAGANASANLYSLIETAKANNLEPYEYIKAILVHLPNAQSVDEIENLLPWNINQHVNKGVD